MNNLNIGETIYQLRKGRNITQEQLANMLGISAGAVSKWETGNSTPDISLLSPLARALHTSIDTLLSFNEELSENEALKIKHELTEIFLHQSYETGEAKCNSYLKEYPDSIYLKFNVAGLIQMYCCMSEAGTEEFINEKLKYSLGLFYEVAESKEPKYSPVALFCIASIEMRLENYEGSEKALNDIPQTSIDPMSLLPSLYLRQGKNDEAFKLCSRLLMQYVNHSNSTLITLANASVKQEKYEKALFYLETAYKLQDTFKISLHSAEYNYCKLYIKLNDKQNAAKWFKAYAIGIISADYDNSNNPYFNSITLEINADGQKVMRKKLFETIIGEDDTKVLEGISEYDEAINALTIAINNL